MSRAHYHVQRYAAKQVAVNRAVFAKVKRVLYKGLSILLFSTCTLPYAHSPTCSLVSYAYTDVRVALRQIAIKMKPYVYAVFLQLPCESIPPQQCFHLADKRITARQFNAHVRPVRTK